MVGLPSAMPFTKSIEEIKLFNKEWSQTKAGAMSKKVVLLVE